MNNYRAIDSIRGIFAILIVLHHYLPAMNMTYYYDFGNTIVLFFFVLSGFHITLTWKDKIAGSYREFLIKRCSKIFPLQWLTVVLYLLFGINIASLWAIPFHLTLTQSLNPFWYINFTLNTPSWFLSCIFFCYIFFPRLLKYYESDQRRFIVIQICTILLFTIFLYVLPETIGRRWLSYINPFARLLDFSVGMTLGVLWQGIKKYANFHKKQYYTTVEILMVVLVIITMIWQPIFAFNTYRVLRYPIIIGFIIIFTLSKGRVSHLLENKILNWLGGISMSIYMIHGFILYFSERMTTIPIWFNVGITFALILLFSHAINRYFLPFGTKYFVQATNYVLNWRKLK